MFYKKKEKRKKKNEGAALDPRRPLRQSFLWKEDFMFGGNIVEPGIHKR